MKGEKSCGPVTYRMHVIARDAEELAANAGGLIVDRMMSGWRVSVQLLEACDTRPVQILGAELVDAMESPARPEECQCVLVMDAHSYARAISADGQQLPSGCAEVLVWGEAPDPGHRFGHNLSAAARAFKTQALAATHRSAAQWGTAEAFTSMNAKAGGVTLRA